MISIQKRLSQLDISWTLHTWKIYCLWFGRFAMVINKTIGRWGGPDNLTSLGTNISQGKKNVRAGSARERKNAPPGGLEPPTFRLTAERASQLRHGGHIQFPVTEILLNFSGKDLFYRVVPHIEPPILILNSQKQLIWESCPTFGPLHYSSWTIRRASNCNVFVSC